MILKCILYFAKGSKGETSVSFLNTKIPSHPFQGRSPIVEGPGLVQSYSEKC